MGEAEKEARLAEEAEKEALLAEEAAAVIEAEARKAEENNAAATTEPDQELVDVLVAMGFPVDGVRTALSMAEGDLEAASEILLSQPPAEEAAAVPEPEAMWDATWDEVVVELKDFGFQVSDEEIVQVVRESDGNFKAAMKAMVAKERASQ